MGFSATDQLAMVKVAIQLQTLARHPVVGAAAANGTVSVVGLFFDIPTARVRQIDTQTLSELAAVRVG